MKEAVITSSILIICITLLRQFCKNKISAGIQYALWLVVAVRLILPGVTVFFPNLLPRSDFSILNVANRMERTVQDYIQPESQIQDAYAQESFTIYSIDELSFLPEMEIEKDESAAALQTKHIVWTWADGIRAIWYLGMAAAAVWMFLVNIRFGYHLYKNRRVYRIEDFRLPVYTVEKLSSPCLYGLPFRQAVYISADVVKDKEKIKHILAHEYCHYKHKDMFWSALRCMLVIVYWFHPLVWLAAALSKQDCELACDEAAIKILGEEERIAYGKTLVSLLIRRTRASDIVCTATTMTAGAGSMKERISRIAEKPRRFAAVLVLAAAVVGITATAAFTRSKEYPENTYLLEGESSQTVTTSCFQITFPDSFARKAYYRGANGTDIIVYHKASDREIGRFCMMSYEEAAALADKQEVVPMKRYGSGSNLSSYINRAEEGVSSEDSYSEERHDFYEEEENGDGITDVPGTDSSGGVPGTDSSGGVPGTDSSGGVPGTDSNGGVSGTDSNSGISGTDSNNDDIVTTYEYYIDEPVMAESSSGVNPIPAPEEVEKEVIHLPYDSQNDDGIGAPRPVGEDETIYPLNEQIGENIGEELEESYVYLPDEKVTITSIAVDMPCYLYIPADYTDAEPELQAELEEMNEMLVELTDSVLVLFQHKETMEYILDVLVQNRTPYVGDAVKASKIASTLPIASGLSYQYLELETTTQPYMATLHYQLQVDNLAQVSADTQFLEAVLMFAAIENLEQFNIRMNDIEEGNFVFEITKTGFAEITYKRTHMEEMFGPLYSYSETKEGMIELYNKVLEYLQEKNKIQE